MKRLFVLTIAVSLILVTSFCYAEEYKPVERNYDKIQHEELRRKIDWQYNDAHDALSKAYYEGTEFIWNGKKYGILDKETFDKLHGMLWNRYEILFHKENKKQANPYPESEYNEMIDEDKNIIKKDKEALEKIKKYKSEGIDIDL